VVFSEAYAPEHALKITETHKPDLVEPFNCRASQWAVYQDGYRLVKVEDAHDELFALEANPPLEIRRLEDGAKGERRLYMNGQLELFLEKAQAHRLDGGARGKMDIENEMVRQRLRNLGYLE
jgi:hypothetical protein